MPVARRTFGYRFFVQMLLIGAVIGAIQGSPALAGTETAGSNLFGTGAGDPADGGGDPATVHTSAFGASAGDLTTGADNSYFGFRAGKANVTGTENAFFGASAGLLDTAGSNSFFGAFAGQNTTSGSGNSFFGHGAGAGNTTGAGNVFIGSGAGSASTASVNVFVGVDAGSTSTGGANVFVGYSAGAVNTSGGQNVFIGTQAGNYSMTGTYDVYIGASAGNVNVDGNSNTMVGTSTGGPAGSNNAFFGSGAGSGNTGLNNTFIGPDAGSSGNSGTDNTFVGNTSGVSITTGSFNTTLGSQAGQTLTTESNDTSLGAYADIGATAVNASAIGYRALATQNDTVVIGSINGVNGATATTRLGLGTTAPTKQLHVKGDSAGSAANNRTAVRVENTSATTAQRTMMELVNNGNSLITFTDTSLAQSWSFQNQGAFFLFQRNGNVPFKVSDTGQIFARNGAAPNHFVLSATGNLTIGGVLTQGSDVNSKKDIVALDGDAVLGKLATLPVSEWSYKTEDARHIGPMAQDFHAVFGAGDDDTRLAPGDEAGVALAAAKTLSERVATLQAQNDALSQRLATAERGRADTQAQLDALMQRVDELAAAAGGRVIAAAH
jgi:hypothetical protein